VRNESSFTFYLAHKISVYVLSSSSINICWKCIAALWIVEWMCGCSKQQSVIQQLQARKGRLIVMCTKGDANLMCPNGGYRFIEVPQLQDCLQPIINIVPFQACLHMTHLWVCLLREGDVHF